MTAAPGARMTSAMPDLDSQRQSNGSNSATASSQYQRQRSVAQQTTHGRHRSKLPHEMTTPTTDTATTSAALPEERERHWRRYRWTLFVAIGILLGIYEGMNQAIGTRHYFPAWQPFTWELSSVFMVFALIPAIIRFEDRFRVDSRPRLNAIRIHIAAGVVFSAIHTTGMVLIRKLVYQLMGDSYTFGELPTQWFYELQKDLITYLVILIILFAAREFRIRRAGELRARQLAAELSEARLRHLTAQIEPHFLFNSLNAISNRMHEDIDAADRMISQLGDLLRAAYESDDHVWVPLSRELGWLRGYTAMMGERYRGQLEFEIEADPGIEALQVPRLLLQPIIENALKHGLVDGRGWLRVEVRRDGKKLRYVVSDDGVGFSDQPPVQGTGISNIARRLELLFPGDHELQFSSRQPRGAVVTLSFPV
jgi:two-component system, LytTR family, sensor kinase